MGEEPKNGRWPVAASVPGPPGLGGRMLFGDASKMLDELRGVLKK
jgi:hypothetical protein